jgi:pilus assembly protein CpaB
MGRAVAVIALAVVCGLAAAYGAIRVASKRSEVKATSVFVAANAIRRGAAVVDADIKVVQWPAEFVPGGVITDRNKIVGRSALTSISVDEPFFSTKLSDAPGSGFASNAIPKGMRACTIRTTGPSASVAGFVRPGDHVDVLLNLKGQASDETGGGSTIALLQAVEILAIDDILDVDAATMKMWVKDGLASVTLLVTPEQAKLLSLGQAAGTLSLSLRNSADLAIEDSGTVMLRDVNRTAEVASSPVVDLVANVVQSLAGAASGQASDADAGAAVAQADAVESEEAKGDSEPPPVPPSFIRTLRGSQAGQIRVVELSGASS